MKKVLCPLFLVVVTLLIAGRVAAQGPSTGDTASYPYWIRMMQDPGENFFRTQRAFELYWKDRPITKGCGWKVFKRWEYMMQSRVLPNGDRPAPDAVMKAYQEYMRYNLSASGAWTSLGPAVIPAPGPAGYEGLGRINVVAFHPTDPQTLFIGAPSGGMWQTTNGGATWVTHTDTLPTLGVSAIAVDYSNSSVILIGTGDRDAGDAPGLGVYRSTNGGLTWAPWKTGMGDKTVGKIIQNPQRAQSYLAATNSGIFRTLDGGATWTLSRTGNFKDICYKPGDTLVVYATADANFWRSSNGGASFTQVTSGLTSGQRGAIAVTAANPNYVYFLQSNSSSGFKGLYRSTDAGLNFTTRSTSPNILDWSCTGTGTGGQGWYDLAIAADPVNAETIYVGGVNVFKSFNGGTTWTINSHWYGGCSVPAVHADCHYLAYNPADGRLYATNDGGIYYTTNGGTNWTDITTGITIGQIYKLGQSQTVKGQVINGFQDNGTYSLYPTGWEATGGGDGMECAVDYQNAAYMYHTIYYGDIFRTINNNNETQIAGNGINGITEGGAWVTPFILGKTDPKVMFAGYKNIWRCNDVKAGTVTWTKISDNLGSSNGANLAVLEQSPANTGIMYAARYDNKLFRTDNCMATSPTWVDLTANLPATGTANDLEAHPTDPNTVYMTLGNGIYKSTDKGLTWTNITGTLPAVSKNAIAYYKNASEGLYVGTDAGVYYKDQNTGGWISFNTGMPANAIITELEIYYDNDSVSMDVIRASSYGRGLWGSDMYNPYVADFTADSTIICAGQNVDFTDLSTATPTSWSWSFPGGTPSVSSQQNPQNIVYTVPGSYNVTLTSYYGTQYTTTTKNAYITVNPLVASPAQPAGDTLLCENNSNTAYTIPPVTGATSYQWFLAPPAAGVLSPSGTSCTIDWDNSFTGYANLQVQGTGDCGTGPLSPALSIHLRPFPGVPATPTGMTSLCSGTIATEYSTAGASNANTYSWRLLPADAGTIAGTGTTSSVTWDPLFTGSADIDVKAVNDCNESSYSPPLSVVLHPTPLVSLGPDTILCDYQSTILDAGNPGASYLWSSGETTQTIEVDSAGTGYGNTIRWVLVTQEGCTGSDTIGIGFTICEGIDSEHTGMTLRIFPNPTPGKFTVSLVTKDISQASFGIYNMLGEKVAGENDQPVNRTLTLSIDLSGKPGGIYLLRLEADGRTMIRKIVLKP